MVKIEAILPYEYVSFDLFDTLIFRSVEHPTDIFDICGYLYSKQNKTKGDCFKNVRMNAERTARTANPDLDDICIDDIYPYIDEKEFQDPELEKAVEISASMANTEMISFLNEVKKLGKKVVITSDMYLDEDTVKSILRKNHIACDYLFLSSSVGKTKATGSLYEHILHTLKIDSDQIIHIGDNRNRDYRIPLRRNMQAILYSCENNRPAAHMCRNKELLAGHLNSFIRKERYKYASKNKDLSYFDIGYGVYGPFIYEFSRYLNEYRNKYPDSKILFLSRDGYLLKEAYESIYPEDRKIEYAHLNRNIVMHALLFIDPSPNCFWDCMQGLSEYSVDMIAEAINPESYLSILDTVRGQGKTECTFSKYDAGKEFLEIYRCILDHSKSFFEKQYDLLVEYLKNTGIPGTTCIIVNNSTFGSCQYYLQKIADHAQLNITFLSVQFITSDLCEKRNHGRYRAFISENLSGFERSNFYHSITPFELLMFPQEGTAKYLKDDGVILGEIGTEKENREITQNIQQLALQFIKDYQDNLNIGFNNRSVKLIYDLFTFPTKAEAFHLRKLNRFDINGRTDLSNAGLWKAGAIKTAVRSRLLVNGILRLKYLKNSLKSWIKYGRQEKH